jgi:uncharacterized membrane protein
VAQLFSLGHETLFDFMEDNKARVVSTVAIWIVTALIFIFGVFKCNATGDGIYLWFFVGIALAISPAIATRAIWKSK